MVALGVVTFLQCLLVLCLVSAAQLPAPRNMPFGATGSSAVLIAAQSKISLQTKLYPSEPAAREAIDQSRIYGAYIPGARHDTLLVAAQKSYTGVAQVVSVFETAARHDRRQLKVEDVKPLPKSDPVAAVVGLLLLPTLLGGLLAAILVFKATGAAAPRWRAVSLIGYAVVGAFITDLVAGPLIGAYTDSHFWPLLPCFILVTAAVALFAAGLRALLKSVGTIVVLIMVIIVGGASACAGGPALLPAYWQNIGAWLPPRYAVELYRNVLYVGGNNISSAIAILAVYALIGICLIFPGAWLSNRVSAPAPAGQPIAHPGNASGPSDPAKRPGHPGAAPILVALAIVAFMQFMFTLNYMSSGHEPVASQLPFGVTGPSSVLTAVEHGGYSLKVTRYPSEKAVKDAINQARLYGALIPGRNGSTLVVVPTASALAPSNLEAHFERAAFSQRQRLHVQAYAPKPLPPKDPSGIVEGLMLGPLLIGGYMSATLLRTATRESAARWRAAILAGFSLVAGMLVNLIVAPWLGGYPTDRFWIVWPILSLVIYAVAMVAAVLGRLIGAAGTLVTIIVIVLFGNPSSGGANGDLYLPAFWRDIGPYLPPRNAYILLHNTIYFSGHGTTQALVVLLVYAAAFTLVLGVLEWFRTPTANIPVAADTEGEAAAMAIPVGAPP